MEKSQSLNWTNVYKIDILNNYPNHILMQGEKHVDLIVDKIHEKRQSLDNRQVNLEVIDEFRKKWQRFIDRQQLYKQAKKEFFSVSEQLEIFRSNRENLFLAGFQKISKYFKECYQSLAIGGDASLDLIDSSNPFDEGILMSVRPPDKSWKKISKLSGGEKTLTSLSLVYALHFFRPNSFYFMDEIDAALDYKNVGIVSKFIRERAKNAQFIVISLVNNMFEKADRLVGIYKIKGVTRNVLFYPETFAKKNDEQENSPFARMRETS